MFGSSSKNRRKKSPKQRRHERRQTLEKWGRRLGITAGLLAVACGLPALIFWGYSQVMESEYFALEYVDVEGLHHLREEDVLEAAERLGGEHILEVHPEELERIVESLDFVDDAEVERRFPDRLHVVIEEHDPAAIVVDDGFWLANWRGEVFYELQSPRARPELWELPMISGLGRGDLESERGRRRLREALELVTVYEAKELDEEASISEVHVDELLGYSLVVGQTGTEIRLGRGRWESRLDRLEVVRSSLSRRGVEPTYILIDHETDLERVAVGRRTDPGSTERPGDAPQ